MNKPKPNKIRVYVSESYEKSNASPTLDWGKTGVTLISTLQRNGHWTLYVPEATKESIRAEVQHVKTLAHGAPFGLSFYGFSERLTWNPAIGVDHCQWMTMPESEWQSFLQRWRWLCDAALEAGANCLLADSEIYPFTPAGNRGLMNAKAWKVTPELKLRAMAFGDAVHGLKLGTWVYLGDALNHKGFKQWWQEASLDLLFGEESFYGHDLPTGIKKTFPGSEVIPGTWVDWGKVSDANLINLWREEGKNGAVWAYDQEGGKFCSEAGITKLARCVARLNGLTPP